MGLSISSSGIRSSYLLACVIVMRAVLNYDPEIFINPEKPFNAPKQFIKRSLSGTAQHGGYSRGTFDEQQRQGLTLKIYEERYTSSGYYILLKAFRASTYFGAAVSWWNMLPKRTIGSAKKAISLLHEAIKIATEVKQENVCIYSPTRNFREVMPVDKFIQHVNRCLQQIHASPSLGGELSGRQDSEVLGSDENSMGMILTLNWDI